jgi:TolB-like protein
MHAYAYDGAPVPAMKPVWIVDDDRSIRWVLEKALAQDRAVRHQTATELAAELRGIRLRPDGAPPGARPRPSVAVLAFEDMSPERDQEYLCEGMAEEILNALTRLRGLRVIARTSAFRFRDEPDLRKVGQALGVDVVLQGSVRRADQRLRITAQLVNVADDSHIWSERFDREMTDVFEIQDEIADAIVKKLHVSLGTSEPSRRPTENVAAYEALVEARHFFFKFTPAAAELALVCLRRALSLDPDYPDALVLHAFYHFMMGYMFANPLEVLPQVKRLAERADELAELGLVVEPFGPGGEQAGVVGELARGLAQHPHLALDQRHRAPGFRVRQHECGQQLGVAQEVIRCLFEVDRKSVV